MTGTGYNDTFSRPSKDLEGVPAMYASSGKAAAWRGYDAVKPSAACGIPGPGKGPAGGAWQIRQRLENIHVAISLLRWWYGFL